MIELRDDEAGVIPLSLIFVSLTALILVFRGRLAKRREHSQRILSPGPGRVIACALGIAAAAMICVVAGTGSRYGLITFGYFVTSSSLIVQCLVTAPDKASMPNDLS